MSEEYATGFKSVFDLERPRSWLAALGFYFFHLLIGGAILGGLGAAIMTIVLGVKDPHEQMRLGVKTGAVIASIYCTCLHVLIVDARAAWRNPRYLIGLVLTVGLAAVGGALLGLIPASVTLGIKPSGDA